MDLKCKNEDEVIKLLELIDFNECYFNKENNFEKGTQNENFSCNDCYELAIQLMNHQISHNESNNVVFHGLQKINALKSESSFTIEIIASVKETQINLDSFITEPLNIDVQNQDNKTKSTSINLESKNYVKQDNNFPLIDTSIISRKDDLIPPPSSSIAISKQKNRLICDICSRTFANKVTIKRHLHRKHICQSIRKKKKKMISQSILCEICGKGFSNRKCLLIHLKTHEIRQVYRCSICDKEYLDKGAMREHMFYHSGEKPFKCLYGCGLSFAHACNRRQHHRSLHEPENHFTCQICGKILTRKGGYTEHMRTHTGEQPYTCEFCSKCFSSKKSLRNHRRIHTGDRPYKCERCHKAFIEHKALKIHMKKKTLCTVVASL